MRLALALAVFVVAGCHVHRDDNGPGLVDPSKPPATSRRMVELPDDPGERYVYVSPGVIIAGGGSSVGDVSGGVFDGAVEVTLGFGEEAVSHNDNAARDRMFIPPGWRVPRDGYGFTLGWSALRAADRALAGDADGDGLADRETVASTGALYVEAHRFNPIAGAGPGWSFDPATGATGPELFAYLMYFHVRARWMIGDGAEILLGAQLKWPFSWVTSR